MYSYVYIYIQTTSAFSSCLRFYWYQESIPMLKKINRKYAWHQDCEHMNQCFCCNNTFTQLFLKNLAVQYYSPNK